MRIDSEALAYWYLRLNGFLTITNFLVHPETRRDHSTEVDILGVRFPFRRENLARPMKDDGPFTKQRERPYLIIAEVKNSECQLNGPWTNPAARNMEKVLAAIGVFPRPASKAAAAALYKDGLFEDSHTVLSLLCIGRSRNADLECRFRRVPQLTFEDVLRFIHGRLVGYLNEKAQHAQWDPNGQALWNAARHNRDVDSFLRDVSVEPGQRA